jgi:hypothetical protein
MLFSSTKTIWIINRKSIWIPQLCLQPSKLENPVVTLTPKNFNSACSPGCWSYKAPRSSLGSNVASAVVYSRPIIPNMPELASSLYLSILRLQLSLGVHQFRLKFHVPRKYVCVLRLTLELTTIWHKIPFQLRFLQRNHQNPFQGLAPNCPLLHRFLAS